MRERDEYGTVRSKTVPTDVVTEVDARAQAMIVEGITSSFPLDGVLAEEQLSRSGSSGRTWIVDPLDGTANYVRGLWPSAVSIGVECDGELVTGVVYDPRHDEMYCATRDEGAYRNGVRLPSRGDAELSLRSSFVAVSGAEVHDEAMVRPHLLEQLARLSDSVRDLGCSALSLCYVADGRFDAHIALGVQRWDVAAGYVIAREAGCDIAPLVEVGNESAIVAPPSLQRPLRDAFDTAWAQSSRRER